MPRKLTPEEVRRYLDAKPGWMVLTSISSDGYPHSVPLGYFRIGDDIYLGTRAGTRKLHNVRRQPRVSLLVESGSTMDDLRGVMIQGDATVHDAPDEVLEIARSAARARGVAEADLPTSPSPTAAYVRVVPRRVISWDYSDR